MRIRTQLILAFLAIVLLTILVGAFAVKRFLQDAESSTIVEAAHVADAISLSITSGQAETQRKPLFQDAVALQDYVKDLERLKREITIVDNQKKVIASVAPDIIGSPFAADPSNEVGSTLTDGVERTFVESKVNPPGEEREIVVQLRAEAGQTLGAVIVEYTSLYNERLSAVRASMAAVAAIVLSAALLAVLLGFSFARHMGNPLLQLQAAAGEIAHGNTDVRVQLNRQDEFGELAQAFNQMALDLSRSRIGLEQESQALAQANEQLQAEIAERKKVEALAKQAEAFETSLLENAPMAIYVHSRDGYALLVNRAAETVFHRSRDEMLGRLVKDVFPPDMAHAFLETNQRVLDSAAPLTYESALQTSDGTRYFQTVKFPVRDASGEINSVGGLSIDVTERQRAEQALAASEQRFRALIEKSSEAIVLLGMAGTVLYTSPATTRILGGAVDGGLGSNWLNRVHPDDLPLVSNLLSKLAQAPGESKTVEFRYLHRDGAWRWLEAIGTNLLAESSVQAIVGNFRDITERKRTEEEIRRQTAHAEALAHTAARLNAQLDLASVLKAVCEETARAMNVPASALRLYDPRRDELLFAGSYGLPHAFSAFKPSPRSLYDKLVDQQGDLIIAQDVQALESVPNRDFYAAFDIRTVVTAMMLRGSQLIGGLSIFTMGEAREFNEAEQVLLRGLANQAAQAILNAQLFDETQRRLGRLRALRAIDSAITASVDLNFTLNRVLEEVTTQLQVDAADILQFNERENMLQYVVSLGFRSNALQHTRLRLGAGYAGTSALERRRIKVLSLTEAIDGLARAPLLPAEGFVSYYAVPLIAKGQIKGVLEIFHRTRLDPEPEWEEFLEVLAGQAAIAIDNGQLFDNLQRSNLSLRVAYDSTLEGWSRALDLRDEETEGHTQRVTEMTLRLARAMGLDEEDLVQVRRGALLHDIGKMGVPDNILRKPGPLSDDEWVIMRKHPVYAFDLLAPIAYLRPALDIPYCHHEKWDGTGYPRGLKGEQIPLAARLFSVVDVWDALRSDRPYRPAWAEGKVREHIRSLTGTHFDPRAVEAFWQVVSEAV
jgi:PAS domain S-box-containing protein/putative nucleotidyltransferase with HDIG domain